MTRKQSGQRFFFSPQLILQFTEGSNSFITEKLYFSKDTTFSRGGGVQFLSREGYKCLFL